MSGAVVTIGGTGVAAGSADAAGSEESAVLRRAAAGDRAAMTSLVQRHQGRVRGLLLRLSGGDGPLADDLAQEVFLRAFRGLVGFRGKAAFSTWLYRIAYNVFINHRARTRSFAPLPPDYDAKTPAPRDALSAPRSDLRRDLETAIQRLPERYRTVVILYYLEEVTYPEIADILDVPLGTVKTHLHRAKRALRRLMVDAGFGTGADAGGGG